MSAPPAIRPRAVFCPTEHEHRDLALAEEVAAGRFPIHGRTLALGTEPDWVSAPLPGDAEWRIEWVKFAYGLDLAHAYATTGDDRFRASWERLVASWIARVPPDTDASEVTARRIQNWIYAWQRLPVSGEVAAALAESIAAQARHVRDNLAPERNHRTLELYALLVVALALPELDDGSLLEPAVEELHCNLLTDFRPDGVHREASTHYHLIALRSFVAAAENARRYGVELPAGFRERLWAACNFALHCRRPDGTIPALSDADTGDYTPLLALAGELLGRDDLRSGRAGACAASFPDGGYHVQRSGWDADARFLILDCGPLGDGGHGHYDLLSFEAWGHGRPLVVDPGRFTYAEGRPNMRRWFRGTAAHNTVVVDGLDQTPYARGRSRAPAAEGRFLGRSRAAGLDVLSGEARSPLYDAVHRRRIVFVGGEYWILDDRLDAEERHTYDLRLHLSAEAEGATRVTAGGRVEAPGLALVIHGADEVRIEPGWVSPRYGVRHPAPVVSAVARDVRRARFVTVLIPESGS